MLKRIMSLPWLYYFGAVFIIAFDQITKVIASSNLVYNEPVNLFYGFNFTLRHNYGVAFSMFDDGKVWQVWILSALAAGVSAVLMVWIARLGRAYKSETLGYALVLGGAIGNLIDRLVLGYVVDFIEVYYQSYFWPAFNIADSAICIGAGFLIYSHIFINKVDVDKSVKDKEA